MNTDPDQGRAMDPDKAPSCNQGSDVTMHLVWPHRSLYPGLYHEREYNS